MNPRTRSSLLWGVVGALTFLVLLQAHALAGGEPATAPVAIGVAVGVGVAATGLSHVAARRLDRGSADVEPRDTAPDPGRDPDADGGRARRDGPNQRP